MKNILITFLLVIPLIGCDDKYDHLIETYNASFEEINATQEPACLVARLFETEMLVLRYLPVDGAVNAMDSESSVNMVFLMRDSMVSLADRFFSGNTCHFVEKRTVLYNGAAESYKMVRNYKELQLVKEYVEKYSVMAYVDGERACDPPVSVREAYAIAREMEQRGYRDAARRIDFGIE